MTQIEIIVGSMLGGTEYVAEAAQEALLAKNKTSKVHFTPQFQEIDQQKTTWLICCSTHGAGDLPDNIKKFVEDLKNSTNDLSTIKYALIGTGDSSYDTFCNAIKTIESILNSKNCIKIVDTLYIDMQQNMDPEEITTHWIEQHQDLF